MPNIDISVIGDQALVRQFNRLPVKAQKKVIRPALRRAAYRQRRRIVDNIKADNLVKTGNMLNAFKRAKIRSVTRKPRDLIRLGPIMPTRADLNIDPEDKFYYPMALEKRFQFMKNAVDKFRRAELAELARDIGNGIKRVAKR